MPAFSKYRDLAYPFQFSGQLKVGTVCGGIPSDPKVAEAWLKTRMGLDNDATLMAAVANTMAEREVTLDEATALVNEQKHLNGFKRERCDNCTGEYICERKGTHKLFIEGRQLKAALKEAVSVAIAAGKVEQKGWGNTRKWLSTYFPEHVFVVEETLYLRTRDASGELQYAMEPTGVNQRFVHTHRGTGIQYEEYVTGAFVNFTVISDHAFTEKDWAMIWMTGEKQGLGATRSQGYGTYVVEEWTQTKAPVKTARRKAEAPVNVDGTEIEELLLDDVVDDDFLELGDTERVSNNLLVELLPHEIEASAAVAKKAAPTPRKMPAKKVAAKKAAAPKIPEIARI